MIVRLNQFDAAHAERYTGWECSGLCGPIHHTWSAGVNAFEVVIREKDERGQTLTRNYRQMQLRQLIPEIMAALSDASELSVVRLDGPLMERELLEAFRHLPGGREHGRCAVSPARKFDPRAPAAFGSIRIESAAARLARLCASEKLGLERGVRLRAFAVPEELVNPLLDIDELDDERWQEILDGAGLVLGTCRGLLSLQFLTRRFDRTEAQRRLMARLARANSQPP